MKQADLATDREVHLTKVYAEENHIYGQTKIESRLLRASLRLVAKSV